MKHLVDGVEVWNVHGTRTAFERDRAHDAALARLGLRVLRFT